MEINFFLRTEIDFLNIAKFQNIFLCSEKYKYENDYFWTLFFHYIKKDFGIWLCSKSQFLSLEKN